MVLPSTEQWEFLPKDRKIHHYHVIKKYRKLLIYYIYIYIKEYLFLWEDDNFIFISFKKSIKSDNFIFNSNKYN